jgi:hypothetical protein
MSTTPVEDELREQLNRVIEILRPYARSSGRFNDPADVRTAIASAEVALSRARRLASKLTP